MAGKAHMPVDNGVNWYRNIPGYGGKYRASRMGNIQRVFRNGSVRDMTPYRKQGKILRNRLFVHLTINGKSKEVAVLKIMGEWQIEESVCLR